MYTQKQALLLALGGAFVFVCFLVALKFGFCLGVVAFPLAASRS